MSQIQNSRNRRKRVIVTGGAGFIGSNLCRYLLQEDCEVMCIDDLSTGRRENIAEFESLPNFTFLDHDVSKKLDGGLDSNFKPDQIYHLACPASPKYYQKDPVKTTVTCVLGSLNVLELAKANNSVVLNASTSEVYGDPLVHPQAEAYCGNVNPIGVRACYDEGKRCSETLFFDYERQYGTKVRVIRIFNTFGPGMSKDDGRVVSNFIIQALTNQDLTVYGDGSQTRSFQFVSDLIEGMVAMMENKNNFSGPVNLGNPIEIPVKALGELILKLIPQSNSKLIFRSLPSDDPRQRQPDISLANLKLNWVPKVRLEDGLKETIDYFKKII